MLVDTPLGTLNVHDAPAISGAPETWASAVRLCARQECEIIARLPDHLRPTGRLLARHWCGDVASTAAVRAIETGDLASIATFSSLPDVSETTQMSITEAHALMGDDARGARARMLKVAQLLGQGRADEARGMVMQAIASRAGQGAPLASTGAFRAHTGLAVDLDGYPPGSTIEVE